MKTLINRVGRLLKPIKKMKVTKSEIQFNVNGSPVSFAIVHDLPEQFGLSISDALNNWLIRTEVFTAESLCAYINSKGTGHKAITEAEYEKLVNN